MNKKQSDSALNVLTCNVIALKSAHTFLRQKIKNIKRAPTHMHKPRYYLESASVIQH